jgi:hypothetical protein
MWEVIAWPGIDVSDQMESRQRNPTTPLSDLTRKFATIRDSWDTCIPKEYGHSRILWVNYGLDAWPMQALENAGRRSWVNTYPLRDTQGVRHNIFGRIDFGAVLRLLYQDFNLRGRLSVFG